MEKVPSDGGEGEEDLLGVDLLVVVDVEGVPERVNDSIVFVDLKTNINQYNISLLIRR